MEKRLRNNLSEAIKAKPNNGFVELTQTSQQDSAEQKKTIKGADSNRQKCKITASEMRLILAIERKRTADTYGTHHYCKTH
jgi:hypothetical protein